MPKGTVAVCKVTGGGLRYRKVTGEVAWVNQQGYGENGSASSESDDYMVMSIKRKNWMEVKIPGARDQVE